MMLDLTENLRKPVTTFLHLLCLMTGGFSLAVENSNHHVFAQAPLPQKPTFSAETTVEPSSSDEPRDSQTDSPPQIETESIAALESLKQAIATLPDNLIKVSALSALAQSYGKARQWETLETLLQHAASISLGLELPQQRIEGLSQIAKTYQTFDLIQPAKTILDQATQQLAAETDSNSTLQSQLMLNLAILYEGLGDTTTAQSLFEQHQAIASAPENKTAQFPFDEKPIDLKMGLAAQVQSFKETTASIGIDLDLYKQWATEDIFLNSSTYIDFDDSRIVNNFRPGGRTVMVYRNHRDEDWNFFTDFFVTANQDLYSLSNEDEDLEVVTAGYVGAALNLWRGENPNQFLDFQMGLGPRYEYRYVNFQQQRNRVNPTLGLILYGRGFQVGSLKLNEIFYFAPALDDWNNFVISSDTTILLPISRRWSLSNRLFLRYQNDVLQDSPNLEVFFTTGVVYEF